MKLKVKKLRKNSKLPKKAHNTDAGYDLYADEIRFNDRYIEYGTGISIELPKGSVGLIFPRSSISKYDLRLANAVGVIDEGYTGELNLRFDAVGPHHYQKGDRVGQLVVMKLPELEVEEVDSLTESERSSGGFGSSGD